MALHSKCSCVTLSLETTLAGDGDIRSCKKQCEISEAGLLHRLRPLTRKRCNIGDGSSAAWQARYAGRSPARYIGILSNALHFLLLNAAVELSWG